MTLEKTAYESGLREVFQKLCEKIFTSFCMYQTDLNMMQ